MNILYLNNFYYLRGGSERILFDEMRMFKEKGHEVAIYTRSNPKNEHADYERFFSPNLPLEDLGFSLTAGRAIKEIVYSRSTRRGLRHVLKEFKPDVAHAHNIYGRLSTSVLDELKHMNIPTVLTIHDLKLLCPSYLMLNRGTLCERCKGKRFYFAFINKCHKGNYAASAIYALETMFNSYFNKYDSVRYFISPSKFVLNKFLEYGWSSQRMKYVPNFVQKPREINHPSVDGYLLYTGRLAQEKGLITLLTALQKVNPSPHLVIAGDGPDREILRRKAEESELSVTFAGYVDSSRLEEAYRGAKAIILPSECYENAPLSLLEAFAHGKPAIASRIGGIPELIDEGINGVMFEPGNSSDLAKTLSTFLRFPDVKIRAMGLEAKNKVEMKYSAKEHYDRLLQIYCEIVG